MRRTWPFVLVGALISAGAGVMISGLPTDVDSTVIDPASIPSTTSTPPSTAPTGTDSGG